MACAQPTEYLQPPFPLRKCLPAYLSRVRLARFANFLAKVYPLKGRDPVPVGAVAMRFLQHSAQHGVAKAKAVPVPHSSLTCISNTSVKLCDPSVKLVEEQDPG